MKYKLMRGEILTLTRWLLKAHQENAIPAEYLKAAKQWLSKVELDERRCCQVQDKILYRSFLTPHDDGYPGSFWNEIAKVLESPVFGVWRVNDLWEPGQLVYVSRIDCNVWLKGVVETVRDLGCLVRVLDTQTLVWFSDEQIRPRLAGSWRPWEVLESP